MLSKYSIISNFRFNGVGIRFYGEGKIEIKQDSYIGEYSTIQAYKNMRVYIGEKCRISYNVRIYTQSGVVDQDFSKDPIKIKTGDVTINNYVWIGANVFINPGVVIGENAIVGANSVVTKDVPPFSVVGGVPAKLIRYKKV